MTDDNLGFTNLSGCYEPTARQRRPSALRQDLLELWQWLPPQAWAAAGATFAAIVALLIRW